MIELGFNLCDVRRWEIKGDPENRKMTFEKMPKYIREEHGVGQFKPVVNYTDDQGGHDANYRNARPKVPKAKAKSEGLGQTGGSQMIGGTPCRAGARIAGTTTAAGSVGERLCIFFGTWPLRSVSHLCTASHVKCITQSMQSSFT